MCPKGDDPLTTDQADRAIMLRTAAEGGLLDGELSVTFNGETTTLNANGHHTGDRECTSALQALPNIDAVSCRRGPVSEFGGADYLISLTRYLYTTTTIITPNSNWEGGVRGGAYSFVACLRSFDH